MNFLRKLFGGGSSAPKDDAIHLYVRCERCNSTVHVRINPRNDLVPEYGDSDNATGYRLVKEIMDSRCFRIMRAEINYDRNRREQNRQLSGGSFITQAEYEQTQVQA